VDDIRGARGRATARQALRGAISRRAGASRAEGGRVWRCARRPPRSG
jgi:hypothetical protein